MNEYPDNETPREENPDTRAEQPDNPDASGGENSAAYPPEYAAPPENDRFAYDPSEPFPPPQEGYYNYPPPPEYPPLPPRHPWVATIFKVLGILLIIILAIAGFAIVSCFALIFGFSWF